LKEEDNLEEKSALDLKPPKKKKEYEVFIPEFTKRFSSEIIPIESMSQQWPHAPFHFPRVCHRINLAFNDACRNCTFLSEHRICINSISKTLRIHAAVNRIGCTCPSPSTTRWIYTASMIKWLTKHKANKTDYLLPAHTETMSNLHMLSLLLKPLLSLTTQLKGDNEKAADAFPLLYQSLCCYDEIYSKYFMSSSSQWRSAFFSVMEALWERTLGGDAGGIITLMYCFTGSSIFFVLQK
jgi:hypothetical protein